MAVKTEALESELIDAVCARVRDSLPEGQSAQCEAFVRQYYRWVAPEDLAERTADDLYGAATAHWNFARERASGEAKVRVYNPDSDRDGWSSPHTVVEIVSDDMPFLVDSVTMELGRQGYGIYLVVHPVIHVRRDQNGVLTDVVERTASDASPESVLHAEVTREADEEGRENLKASVERVLGEVKAAVEDWGAMRSQVTAIVKEFEDQPPSIDATDIAEAKALLEWLSDDHFTFLGYREYDLVTKDGDTGLRVRSQTGLGILRASPKREFTALKPKALELAADPQPLVVTKANSRATVHRPSYLDYIGIKRFAADGTVVGERRFLGLLTHFAYQESPQRIPLVRGKVQSVLEKAGFPPDSHDAKALTEILESFPRDSLFQIGADELFEIAIGILGVGERQRLRLFVRADPLDRFVACLVLIPRDRFNTQNRERVGQLLTEAFGGSQLDWSLQLSESLLVRVH
jgi:glutamate dehydrogenase